MRFRKKRGAQSKVSCATVRKLEKSHAKGSTKALTFTQLPALNKGKELSLVLKVKLSWKVTSVLSQTLKFHLVS